MNMINRKIGETIVITGGAEISPQVTVTQHYMPGSLNNGDKSFEIVQETFRGSVQTVILSPQTIEAVLKWGAQKANS